jgi:K+-sensing histidine kinase KdpD
MWNLKGFFSAAISVLVVCAVTAVLWHFKLATFGLDHPVFYYLLPIALVMALFGKWPALLGVFTAMLFADFFLYDPLYTFSIDSWEEFGDLASFALLALIAVKCASELFLPVIALQQQNAGSETQD